MGRLDDSARQLCEKCNKPYKHDESCESCESAKCDCDPGTNATCTCARADTGNDCGNIVTRSLKHKYKYTTISTCREWDTDNINITNYIANPTREDASTGVWVSDEPRNFKPTDADSTDPVERRIGIPAGVTV
jgi:hypothetical protein